MLLRPAKLQPTLWRQEAHPQQREVGCGTCWVGDDRRPTVILAARLAALQRVVHAAVAVSISSASTEQRDAVLVRLREADALTVRDRQSRDALARHGIAAALMPDPAVPGRRSSGPRIAEHAMGGEPAALRAALPRGLHRHSNAAPSSATTPRSMHWRAVSAPAARARAGFQHQAARRRRAPWHDDLGALQRLTSLPAARHASPNRRTQGHVRVVRGQRGGDRQQPVTAESSPASRCPHRPSTRGGKRSTSPSSTPGRPGSPNGPVRWSRPPGWRTP